MEVLLQHNDVCTFMLRYLSSCDVLQLALCSHNTYALCQPFLLRLVIDDSATSVTSRQNYTVVQFPAGFNAGMGSLGLSSRTVRHISAHKLASIDALINHFPFLTTLRLDSFTIPRKFAAKSLIYFWAMDCSVDCDDVVHNGNRSLELGCPNLEVLHLSSAHYESGSDYYGQPTYEKAAIQLNLSGCPKLRSLHAHTTLGVYGVKAGVPAVKQLWLPLHCKTPATFKPLILAFATTLESLYAVTHVTEIGSILETVQPSCQKLRNLTVGYWNYCQAIKSPISVTAPSISRLEITDGEYSRYTINVDKNVRLSELILARTPLEEIEATGPKSFCLQKLVMSEGSSLHSRDAKPNTALATKIAELSKLSLTHLSLAQILDGATIAPVFTKICTNISTLELISVSVGPKLEVSALSMLVYLNLKCMDDLTMVHLPANGALVEVSIVECKHLNQVKNLLKQPALETVTIWCCKKTVPTVCPTTQTAEDEEDEETPTPTEATTTTETMLDPKLFLGLFSMPSIKSLRLCTGPNIIPGEINMPGARTLSVGPHVKIPMDLGSIVIRCRALVDFQIHDSPLNFRFIPEQRLWLPSLYSGTRAEKEQKKIKSQLALPHGKDDWTSGLHSAILDVSFPAISIQNAQGLRNVRIMSTALKYLSLGHCSNLEALAVEGAHFIELDLAGCSHLSESNIIDALRNSEATLEALYIGDVPLSFSAFQHIMSFPKLKTFEWCYTRIPAEFVQFSFPSDLVSLRVPFLHFNPTNHLSKLCLTSNPNPALPFDQIYATLPQLPQLLSLSLELSQSCLTSPHFPLLFTSLRKCTSIATLYINVSALPQESLQPICTNFLQSLSNTIEDFTVVSEPKATVEPPQPSAINTKFPRLRKCRILNCTTITGEYVAGIINYAPVLKQLYLDGSTGITLQGFEAIKVEVTKTPHGKEFKHGARGEERTRRPWFTWRREGYAIWDNFEPYPVDQFTFDSSCTHLRTLSVANCGPMMVSTANALANVLDKFIVSEESRASHRQALTTYQKPIADQWEKISQEAHRSMDEQRSQGIRAGLERSDPTEFASPEALPDSTINKCLFLYTAPKIVAPKPAASSPSKSAAPAKSTKEKEKKKTRRSLFSRKKTPPPAQTTEESPAETTESTSTEESAAATPTATAASPQPIMSPFAPADGRHITKRLHALTRCLAPDTYTYPVIGMRSTTTGYG
ncbi:hypothetical protein Pelo_13431 [Pelomyxa schiedti]|nr:hypothetical protein Pelo_13431 [Pelomyxa schiedti]